ncbi:PepSY domain-containing protein [Microbulbifer thermotolerans]|nr:PepSY domain-containing protein [Microbulbifer thermotolerans]
MKVRSDILRIYRSLHTWVGITSGLLLLVGFFAGALTMFKQPMDRWINPPEKRMPWIQESSLDQLVAQVMEQYPSARMEFTLYPIEREDLSAPMVWTETSGGRELDLSAEQRIASLDSNGNLKTDIQMPSRFGDLVDMLHRTGGIPGFTGDEYLGVYILGIAGVLYFLALISGVILLLPTLVKDFFALRYGKNKKRFWLDSHNVVGITSLPFHIVISLTVIVFAFHGEFYEALKEVVYPNQERAQEMGESQHRNPQDILPPSQLLQKVRAEAPGFGVTEMLYMRLDSPRPLVRIAVYKPEELVHGPVTGYVGVDPYSGELLLTAMLPGKAEGWGAIVNYFFALHFGSFGGSLVRWIYFFLGLSGAFLFYSGNLLWIESRRKKLRKNAAPDTLVTQPRNLQWMAAITVGATFGCVIGVCLAMVSGKWMHAVSDNINYTYVNIYYICFAVAIAYALWIGVGRATWHLLLASSLSCALIPLTSFASWLIPGLGLWAYTSLPVLMVDLTAAAFAVVLMFAAVRSRRRAFSGNTDSVWSAYKDKKSQAPGLDRKEFPI